MKEDGIHMGSASSALFAGSVSWVAARRDLEEFVAHLSTTFEKRRRGHIGYGEGCATEMEILAQPRLCGDPAGSGSQARDGASSFVQHGEKQASSNAKTKVGRQGCGQDRYYTTVGLRQA